jgi:hypothetical protein
VYFCLQENSPRGTLWLRPRTSCVCLSNTRTRGFFLAFFCVFFYYLESFFGTCVFVCVRETKFVQQVCVCVCACNRVSCGVCVYFRVSIYVCIFVFFYLIFQVCVYVRSFVLFGIVFSVCVYFCQSIYVCIFCIVWRSVRCVCV